MKASRSVWLPVEGAVFQGRCSKCQSYLEMTTAEAETEIDRDDRGELHGDHDNGWLHMVCKGKYQPPQEEPERVRGMPVIYAPEPPKEPCGQVVTLYRVEPVHVAAPSPRPLEEVEE